MSKKHKILKQALSGSKNISFNDAVLLIKAFGFILSRINGSHHIFIHPKIPELVNIQNVKGQTKPYQVRQFLSLIEKYNLRLED
jgi:predicted RNA binding protein YcfA (HicA-like mRNA interferase family)